MAPELPHRPASSPSKRWLRRLLTGLGVAALLAGVGLTRHRLDGTARQDPAGTESSRRLQDATPRAASRTVVPGASAPVDPVAPRFEPTTCWQDLERFNDEVTLGTFREWAAPLLRARDPLVHEYLKERLTELIGEDAGRAGEVLGWVHDAGPEELGVFMAALRDAPAVHHPQVAARLLELGLDGSLEAGRRVHLLVALETQRRLEPAALGRLAAFARDPASGEAGWVATRTIARVMKRDFQQQGSVTPYLDRLIDIGTSSPDEQIRYLALSTPMHTVPVLDARATEQFAQVLTTEGSEDGREAAAHNLSVSRDRAQVLDLFARAFSSEQSLCVRWALFRFAARAAGRDALPVMAEMALVDPRFQQDYRAFERLYASGLRDFERVWLNLPDQDPHGCLHRD